MTHATARSAPRILAAGVLTALALVLIGNALALGAACPAVYPPSASCGTEAHVPWAVAGVAVVVASLLLILIGELAGRRKGSHHYGAVRLGAILLAISAVVFPLAIAFSGSFIIDQRGILLALLTFVVCIVRAAVVAKQARPAPTHSTPDSGIPNQGDEAKNGPGSA